MAGPKTNEREGTRAVLRHARMSPYKVREVLDLIRGRPVHEAEDILRFSERDAAIVVGKVLHSAVANAENNDELDPEELLRFGVLRRRGHHDQALAAPGPGPGHPHPQADQPRHHHRQPAARTRSSRGSQARRRAERLAQRARRVAGARRAEGDSRNRADRRRGVRRSTPEVDDHDHDQTRRRRDG